MSWEYNEPLKKFKVTIKKEDKVVCEGEFEDEPYNLVGPYIDTWIVDTPLSVEIRLIGDA